VLYARLGDGGVAKPLAWTEADARTRRHQGPAAAWCRAEAAAR
jgi:penicillin-binding protein 1C